MALIDFEAASEKVIHHRPIYREPCQTLCTIYQFWLHNIVGINYYMLNIEGQQSC